MGIGRFIVGESSMNARTWYVERDFDSMMADVYRGDSSEPLDSVEFAANESANQIAIRVHDSEIEEEIGETAVNTARRSRLLREGVGLESGRLVVSGLPPSQR